MTLTPHPWNNDFEWSPVGQSATTLSEQQVTAFNTDGFFVIDDLVDAATLAEATAAIDEIEAEREQQLRGLEGERLMIAEAGAIVFAAHLTSLSPALRNLAADPRIARLAVDLIGPDVNLYWDQAVYKKPEKPRRFPWHQDNGYTFVEPQQYLTVWLALNDATEDNGCPWVAPTLHLGGTLSHDYVDPLGFECFEEPPHKVPAPVRAGGAAVFSSLTPHLTGPNTSDHVRKAYILQYAPVGAHSLRGDPTQGPATSSQPCTNEINQFPVARNGHPVA